MQVRPKEDAEAIFSVLSPSELAGRLDLRPFMQRHPFVVAADASMSRAYRLFRTMGLRHMFVGPSTPQVSTCCHSPPPNAQSCSQFFTMQAAWQHEFLRMDGIHRKAPCFQYVHSQLDKIKSTGDLSPVFAF